VMTRARPLNTLTGAADRCCAVTRGHQHEREPVPAGVQAWRCKTCGTQLGDVDGGGTLTLTPAVRAESIDRRGVARVPCPECGRVKVWWPSTPGAAGVIAPAPDPTAPRQRFETSTSSA
jgi:hypothetical protein